MDEQDKNNAEERKDDNDNISIDFSKIKNFFKKIKIKKERDDFAPKDEDIQINWKPVLNFLKNYGFVLIALIPIFLSINIRMLSMDFPVTDGWATDAVHNSIRSNIKEQINQQYPTLPDANKNEIVERELGKFISENKQQVDEQVKATSNFFKDYFRDENGKGYMPDIDPYYWYRYAKNILEKGHPYDELRDGEPFDTYQLAPAGRPITEDMFHSYFLAYFHRFISILSPNITLFRSISYYPIFISALSVLVAFILGRKIAGNVGGFFAALMLSFNQSLVGRTLFGHADSDAWVVFFPLIITLIFFEALESKKLYKSILLSVLGGLFVVFYSSTWSGWWFIFDFLLGVAAVSLIVKGITLIGVPYIKSRKLNLPEFFSSRDVMFIIIPAVLFFIASSFFVIVFSDFETYTSAYKPFGLSSTIKAPVHYTLWPNVLTTVAELNPGSYEQVVNSMGGKVLWFISIIGILLAFLKKDRNGKLDIKYGTLMALWLIAAIYSSLLGIRFTLLVAPVFSIGFGAALGTVYKYSTIWGSKGLHIHKAIIGSILVVIFLIPLFNPIEDSRGAAKSDLPLINDVWYNSLTFINQNSTKNAIITSWWDFGHHFKALADRGVTFDGTTQTSIPAHWVGRFFSTSDENEALGIMRMLDCGNRNGFRVIWKILNEDTHKSLKILREIILLDKEDAVEKLRDYKFNEKDIQEIIQYTHCDAPEGYVIASDDMIGKSGVWGHFGAWDFERADIWFNLRDVEYSEAIKYMTENFSYTKEKADTLYKEVNSITSNSEANSWIAPWPGYGGTSDCTMQDDNITIQCDNGLEINTTDYEISAVSNEGIVHPEKFAYLDENNEFRIKEYTGSTKNFGVTLVNRDDKYFLVVSSPELTGGMFTRMFYMGGKGLKNFELVKHEKGLTGTEVYVYKVKV